MFEWRGGAWHEERRRWEMELVVHKAAGPALVRADLELALALPGSPSGAAIPCVRSLQLQARSRVMGVGRALAAIPGASRMASRAGGAAGVAGGAALTATGIGAPVGVPMMAAAALARAL